MGVSRVTCYAAVARAPTPPTPFAARLANLVPSSSLDDPSRCSKPKDEDDLRRCLLVVHRNQQLPELRLRASPAVPGPTEALHAATVTQPVAAEHWLHSHRPLSSWQQRKQRRRTCRQSRCRRPLEHGRLTRHLLRRVAPTPPTPFAPTPPALHVAPPLPCIRR